jgi:hypothetical protein
MRTSVSVADRAAQAAEDSLFVAQRPYIFVTAVNFKDPLASETLDYTGRAIWPWIYFHLENHGSTPASIIETCADSACVRELPLVPQYRENATYANPRLLGAGKDETVGYVFKTPIDGEVMMDVATPDFISPRGRHLFAFGYIKYKDIFEYTHTLGFCWRYHLGLKIFVPAEESGYTYRKAEPPKPT